MRMREVVEAKAAQVNALKWYAVRAGTRQEGQLQASLKAKRFTVFYPQWRFWRKVRRSSQPGERPVFPGFIFVLASPERFAEIGRHLVTETDRLDNLAAHHLGDPEQFWRLCDANRALRPDELTETPGRGLRITLPEGIPGAPDA